MDSIELDGVRLVFDTYGGPAAPPMVLLHGGGDDRSTWTEVAAALATTHRVYAPDLRGHGESDWPGAYSFELMRDDVLAFLDALDLHDVTLVGHSMGGTVAWLAAQQRPARLARLVIEDSPPPPAGRTAVPAPPRPDGPLPFDYEAIVAIVGQVNNPDPAWWDELPKVAVPTLIIAGGPDSHVPQDLLGEAAARVPHGRLVSIPAGHHVHRTRPADFVAAVREFLAGT